MLTLVWGQAFIQLALGIERPLRWLRAVTGAAAGRTEKKDRRLVHLPLAVTPEEFDAITAIPVVLQAYHEARLFQYMQTQQEKR